MPRFKVRWLEEVYHTAEIEAADEDAVHKAWEDYTDKFDNVEPTPIPSAEIVDDSFRIVWQSDN